MSSETVLIIGDDKITRYGLHMLLEFEGFIVHSCENGVSALDLIDKEHFEIFLIDYRMPKMNGGEVARRLRPLCPEALIIGFSIESKGREFLAAGADAFIGKNALVHELVPLIKNRMQH